jgi:hypothetical protein
VGGKMQRGPDAPPPSLLLAGLLASIQRRSILDSTTNSALRVIVDLLDVDLNGCVRGAGSIDSWLMRPLPRQASG